MTAISTAQLLGALLGNSEPETPYDYQTRLADALATGRNVVVSAPTGSGKTWAALLPYLTARLAGNPRWDRVLYALPLRSLAASLWQSTCTGCESAGFNVRRAERRWAAAVELAPRHAGYTQADFITAPLARNGLTHAAALLDATHLRSTLNGHRTAHEEHRLERGVRF